VDENIPLTSDERLMAAVSHLFGMVVALIVWATQREKSRFVRFQSIQALAFDGALMLVSTVVFFCLFAVMMLGMLGSMAAAFNDPASMDEIGLMFMIPSFGPFLIFACIFPFSFVILAIRMFAALSILGGRDFRYPIIGKWTESFLEERQ
jgi:uncharacterized Tic20 family protein